METSGMLLVDNGACQDMPFLNTEPQNEVEDYCKNETSCHLIVRNLTATPITNQAMTCSSPTTRVTNIDADFSIIYKLWMGTYCSDNTLAEIMTGVQSLTVLSDFRNVKASKYGASRCIRETDTTTAFVISLDSAEPSLEDIVDCSSDNSSVVAPTCPVLRELNFGFDSFVACSFNSTADVQDDLQDYLNKNNSVRVTTYPLPAGSCPPGSSSVQITIPMVNSAGVRNCFTNSCGIFEITSPQLPMSMMFVCIPEAPIWDVMDPVSDAQLQFNGYFGLLNAVVTRDLTPGKCRPNYQHAKVDMYQYQWDMAVSCQANVTVCFPMPPFMMELVEVVFCSDTDSPNGATEKAAAVVDAGVSLGKYFNLTNETVMTVESPVSQCSPIQVSVTASVTTEWKMLIEKCFLNPADFACNDFPSNFTRALPSQLVSLCVLRNGSMTADVVASLKLDIDLFLQTTTIVNVGVPENCTTNYVRVVSTVYPEEKMSIENCLTNNSCPTFPNDVQPLPMTYQFCATLNGTAIAEVGNQLSNFLNETIPVSTAATSNCSVSETTLQAVLYKEYWMLIKMCMSQQYSTDPQCVGFPPSLMNVDEVGVNICIDGMNMTDPEIIQNVTTTLDNYYGLSSTMVAINSTSSCAPLTGLVVTDLPETQKQKFIQCLADPSSCTNFPDFLKPSKDIIYTDVEVCILDTANMADGKMKLMQFLDASVAGYPVGTSVNISLLQNASIECTVSGTIPATINLPIEGASIIEKCLANKTLTECTAFPSFLYEASVPTTQVPETIAPVPAGALLLCIEVPNKSNVSESNQIIATTESAVQTSVATFLSDNSTTVMLLRSTQEDCPATQITLRVVAPDAGETFIEDCIAKRNGPGCDGIPDILNLRSTTPAPPVPITVPLCIAQGNGTIAEKISAITKELATFLSINESEVMVTVAANSVLACPTGSFEVGASVSLSQSEMIATCLKDSTATGCTNFPVSLSAGVPPEKKDDGFPLYIIFIIAGVVVVIIAVAGVVYWRRTHRPQFRMSFGDQCDALDEMECEKELDNSATQYNGLM